jgi:hypothetical protein
VSGLGFYLRYIYRSVVVGLRWDEMDVSGLGHINGGRPASENGGTLDFINRLGKSILQGV